ncbi:hypothetical protein L861_10430 [Litchfieldella anticariensis FP35 = DSM 16096]|uniref:Uncharacterized protein n=1 Tax=Litchfieldella anticariensis (strain DSM 16096 / CECT 5854 / CIP 108499 / LMG 22089 / FP35) TaxID=1121939 RepID=S2KQJ8_LITA3|nr:hypothetical protein [Halomonas anticariensis]EPC02753.1 hypothetical protein L861_10430 [Halomonas anticariensis FP35 = DSM 16096]
MQKAKAIKLAAFALIAIAAVVYVMATLKASPNYDREVLRVRLSDDVRIVAYRNNQGGATVPFTYHVFLLGSGESVDDKAPFLVTFTPDIGIEIIEEDHVAIEVTGDVHEFTNRLWVKNADGELQRIAADFIARSQPE